MEYVLPLIWHNSRFAGGNAPFTLEEAQTPGVKLPIIPIPKKLNALNALAVGSIVRFFHNQCKISNSTPSHSSVLCRIVRSTLALAPATLLLKVV